MRTESSSLPSSAKFATGAVLFPAVLAIQSVFHSICHLGGGSYCLHPGDYMALPVKNFKKLLSQPIERTINLSMVPIGEQIFFNQFLQKELLDKFASRTLDEYIPRFKYGKFSQSEMGKFFRSCASALAYSAYRCRNEGSTIDSAHFVNHFVLGLIAGALTEWTGSNRYGMGLRVANAHLTQ